MILRWLKRSVPDSLYGRAALIVLIPVVVLQLLVSILFIQRHFDGVTRQMSRNVTLEIELLLDAVNAVDDAAQVEAEVADLLTKLEFNMEFPSANPPRDRRFFYDFTAISVIAAMNENLDDLQAVFVAENEALVRMRLSTRHGDLQIWFDRQRLTATNPHQLLMLMTAGGLLLMLIAFFFLRNQLQPLLDLAGAADAFGKGRLTPYEPTGASEVRTAGRAFVDMRDRLERHIEQRTMMLSGVSHDLRTPLTRLKLGISMLGSNDDTKALERDVEDMERLMDEFLSFVRGDALDDAIATDPAEVLRDVVDRHAGAGADVELTSVVGDGRVTMRPMAIGRALDNLVGNAIRYGRRCQTSLAVGENAICYTIEDDGPGIPDALRDEALKPFSRLDAARNQDKGSGVGLGLAIANDIAKRHGGALLLRQSAALGGLRAELHLAR